MRTGIVGFGQIGREVYRRLKERGEDVAFVARSDGIYSVDKGERIGSLRDCFDFDLDLAILDITTLDGGRIAFNYINGFLDAGARVVTSEKGAMGNYFSELEPRFDRLGFSAVAGGRIGMATFLRDLRILDGQRLDAVVNGTLNYVFDEASKSGNLAEAVRRAQELGYAEPNADGVLDVINQESCFDVPMKSAILFNFFNFFNSGKRIRARDINVSKVDNDVLEELRRDSFSRRYVVSITRNPVSDSLGGFELEADGWHLSGGFRYPERRMPGGVNNFIVVQGDSAEFWAYGEGAGAKATVDAMMYDARRLMNDNKS